MWKFMLINNLAFSRIMNKIFVLLTLLVSYPFVASAQSTISGKKGDVNDDGKVDISDVVAVINIIANPEQEVIEGKRRPLRFTVSENPLSQPSNSDELDEPEMTKRREPATTTSKLNQFYYNYVSNGTLSSKAISTYEAMNQHWEETDGWPQVADDDLVTFYAYANVDLNMQNPNDQPVYKDYDGKIYLSFEADESTSELKDLLIAENTDSYSHSGGWINFQFDHACGALELSINKTESLNDYTVMVQSVILHNIPSAGSYCLTDHKWELETGSEYNKLFTVNAYKEGVEGYSLEVSNDKQLLGKAGNYLFLIPQKLTAWNKSGTPSNAYIEIKCRIMSKNGAYKVGSANDWGSAYLPLGITVKQGTITPVTISMGTALRNGNGNKIFN